MIEWFARNPVAANILMIGVVIAGLSSAFTSIPVEAFPSFEADEVTISTSFRGATPSSTEDGITLRIEEAIADLDGIKEIRSRSSEGLSTISVEILGDYNPRSLLDDIKVRVDALDTLPNDAERPVISIVERNRPVMQVAIKGDVPHKTLREAAERFREGLLANDEISQVNIIGVADYEMTIEVSPQTLNRFNLSLDQIGLAIRRGASDVSGGNIQTSDGDIPIRSNGQAYSASEFSRIPIITSPEGKPITLGDIATIDDGFEEKSLIRTFDGEPAVMINVSRVGSQSALQISAKTKQHMREFSANLPSQISIDYWDDRSEYLLSRVDALLDSAIFGGILVMILLSLFLRPAVALWVFIGIPISFMGAFLFMPHVGTTFNVTSIFAFILVLGIVVDDAIVTGENIYRRIREGLDPMEASIVGTKEITVPVTFGILTTVVAFLPLSFLDGTPFSFIAEQLPIIIIPVLLMSLVESKLVLPSHMSHVRKRLDTDSMSWLNRAQQKVAHGLERFVERYYRPFLERALKNKTISIAILLAISSIVIASTYTGHTRFTPFPRVESLAVRLTLTMPETTSFETTKRHIESINRHFETVRDKYSVDGVSVITKILTTAGSSGGTVKPNIGSVQAFLQDPSIRVIDVTGPQISREIRQLIGTIPGAQSLNVSARSFNFGAPVNIELSGSKAPRMFEMVLRIKERLKSYPGIFDIQDNYSGGKEELTLALKPRAHSLGLRLNDVAEQVRNAVFGFEAQRIQRGRDELRVMVRFPLENRSSIDDLNRLPIQVPSSTTRSANTASANGVNSNSRTGTGTEVSLSDVAEITPFESPSNLFRLNRTSVLNVTADIDQNVTNNNLVISDLEVYLRELQEEFPDVDFRFGGETEDVRETNRRLTLGAIIVLFTIYALLAIPFKSYGQPFIVMSIIPFSMIGAMYGHILTGQNLSMLSIFGMLALLGVVVNDSLVLVDYINKRRQRGHELIESVINAAVTRFRPVLLTSITTFAGLAPILLDGSQQAKWLKPMATSLAFGIIFATAITLIIVPINYIVAHKAKHSWIGFWNKSKGAVMTYWNKEDAYKT